MTDEELKNKYTERAKIFQQAMESCHSSSSIDCIEWFADRIADLEKENAKLKEQLNKNPCVRNTEWYCNDCLEQLTKAKDFILKLTTYLEGHTNYDFEYELIKEVKQFLKESEVEK